MSKRNQPYILRTPPNWMQPCETGKEFIGAPIPQGIERHALVDLVARLKGSRLVEDRWGPLKPGEDVQLMYLKPVKLIIAEPIFVGTSETPNLREQWLVDPENPALVHRYFKRSTTGEAYEYGVVGRRWLARLCLTVDHGPSESRDNAAWRLALELRSYRMKDAVDDRNLDEDDDDDCA